MPRRTFILIAALALILTTHFLSAASRPNFVIILADDLGYGDVSCYNPDCGRIPTPRIDRLASEGIRFTDGHSSSACCSPSRYTLLTGRYHWRTRLQKGICQLWEGPLISPDRLTIGSLARQHGYRTACIGKWHLGWDWGFTTEQQTHFKGFGGQRGGGGEVRIAATPEDRAAWQEVFSRPLRNGPATRGFDLYFGTDVPNWPPYCFIENDRTLGIPSELLPQSLFLKNLSSLQGPALPDWTLEPILPTLADRAIAFIQQQAQARQAFLLYLPLTSPHTPIAPTPDWIGKSGIGEYGDFVMQTDAVVGRVLDQLRDSKLDQETFVLFTSDNGCASYIGVPQMERQGHFPSGPLRDYKASVYEGGHRIPFIIRWPGIVKPGSTSAQLVHHADLFATLAEILGAPLADRAAEDSLSLLPLLTGLDQPIRRHAVSTAAVGIPSLRDANWKLILAPDDQLQTSEQLYDLSVDLGEKTNLALQEKHRVADMSAALEELITRGRTRPGPPSPNDVTVIRYPSPPIKE